jgi:hypothetical protein
MMGSQAVPLAMFLRSMNLLPRPMIRIGKQADMGCNQD